MSSGRLFNSTRASKEWDRLIDDLVSTASQKDTQTTVEALKSRQGKLEVAINVAPSRLLGRDFKAASEKISKQLKTLEDSKDSNSKQSVESRKALRKEMSDLERRLHQRFLASQTSMGRTLSKELERKQQVDDKTYKSMIRGQTNELRRKLAAQLLEIDQRRGINDNKNLAALHTDLMGAMKALKHEDLLHFRELDAKLKDVTKNYGVEDETSERMENIEEYMKEMAEKKKSNREKWGSRAERAADWLGPGVGSLFRGGRSLFRGASKAANTVSRIGRHGRRVASKSGAYAARAMSPLAKKGGSAVSALASLFQKDSAKRDREETSKREERSLLKRQVSALELLGRVRKSGGGTGSGLRSMIGTLGGFGGGILKTAGKFLGPLLSRLGPLALAGFAGWKIGGMIYEKFASEIQDGIEVVVGVVTKAIDFVSRGFDWFKEFLSNPMEKVRAIGGRLKAAWDSSVFAKFFSNPGEVISEAAGSVMKSTKEWIKPASDYVSETSSAALDGLTTIGKSGAEAVSSVSAQVSNKLSSTASAAKDSILSGYNSLRDGVGKLFRLNGNPDIDNLDPAVKQNFLAMSVEHQAMGGKPIQINSAFRSYEEQAKLYAANPKKAAPPGRSSHGKGLAVDVNSSDGNALAKSGLLKKYGFSRPVSGEAWHLEATGAANVLAAQGIYSADNPQNQGSRSSQTNAVPEAASIAPEPRMGSAQGSGQSVASQSQRGESGTMSSAPKVSATSMPTFSFADNGFFMMNIGALGA